MPRRLNRRFVVALAAVLTAGLGWVAAVDAAPAWHWDRSDAISARQSGDQAAVAAPERRITRHHASSDGGQPISLAPPPVVDLAAILAIAAALLVPRIDRRPRRREQYLAWSLRSPPAPPSFRPSSDHQGGRLIRPPASVEAPVIGRVR